MHVASDSITRKVAILITVDVIAQLRAGEAHDIFQLRPPAADQIIGELRALADLYLLQQSEDNAGTIPIFAGQFPPDQVFTSLEHATSSLPRSDLFLVASHAPTIPGVSYIPHLSLVYGALAGEDILVCEIKPDHDTNLAIGEITALCASVPIYQSAGGSTLVYVCAGSKAHLESLSNCRVNLIASGDRISDRDLYHCPVHDASLSRHLLFSDSSGAVLAIHPSELPTLPPWVRQAIVRLCHPTTRPDDPLINV